MSILITGTNRGIGLEFVKHYLKNNEKVIATCRNRNSAKDLLELENTTNNLSLLKLDVSKPNSIDEFTSKIANQPIDTLFLLKSVVLLSIKTEYEENLKKYTYCKNDKKNNMKIIEEVKIE